MEKMVFNNGRKEKMNGWQRKKGVKTAEDRSCICRCYYWGGRGFNGKEKINQKNDPSKREEQRQGFKKERC